jgi:excisionase family DNA binding protein
LSIFWIPMAQTAETQAAASAGRTVVHGSCQRQDDSDRRARRDRFSDARNGRRPARVVVDARDAATLMASVVRPDPAALESMVLHLDQLDRDAALALAGRLRQDGALVDGLITGLLAPALIEVGRRWASGEVGAAEARAAALIAQAATPRASLPTGATIDHPVAVCCPHGEQHEIPAELVTELLRAEGWPALYIGAGVTAKHLPGFFAKRRPAALLVSCTTSGGLAGAARLITVGHAAGVPVMVGGAAFGRDDLLAVRLGAAAWAPTAADAVLVLEGWRSHRPTLPSARPLTEEYLAFESARSEVKASALEAFRRVAPDERDDPASVTAAEDRLELLLQHLGAALLVDDGRLFHEFLSWRSAYYQARHIGPERLIIGLSAVASSLPATAVRARRFVEDGLQHLAWSGHSALVSPREGTPANGTSGGAAASIRPLPSADERGRVFADLLFVAAVSCHAPVALISVAQSDGRWSTLSRGSERRDLVQDDRLFAAIARGTEPLEINDLSRHPELKNSPLATGPLAIRHVYGIPLRDRQATLLGVLCVLDRRPRQLSKRECDAISAIARQVGGQLALVRRNGRRQAAPASPANRDRLATRGADRLMGVAAEGPEPELLRSHEVAVLFDVTERTVINWAAAKRLPSIRTVGGHLRFRADDVVALLAGRAIEGSQSQPIGSLGA